MSACCGHGFGPGHIKVRGYVLVSLPVLECVPTEGRYPHDVPTPSVKLWVDTDAERVADSLQTTVEGDRVQAEQGAGPQSVRVLIGLGLTLRRWLMSVSGISGLTNVEAADLVAAAVTVLHGRGIMVNLEQDGAPRKVPFNDQTSG